MNWGAPLQIPIPRGASACDDDRANALTIEFANVTLRNCSVLHNRAPYGAAINNDGGVLLVYCADAWIFIQIKSKSENFETSNVGPSAVHKNQKQISHSFNQPKLKEKKDTHTHTHTHTHTQTNNYDIQITIIKSDDDIKNDQEFQMCVHVSGGKETLDVQLFGFPPFRNFVRSSRK